MAVPSFFSKHLVAIIMVPVLFGAHYGWYKLQHIDTLVTAEERNKLPITRFVIFGIPAALKYNNENISKLKGMYCKVRKQRDG